MRNRAWSSASELCGPGIAGSGGIDRVVLCKASDLAFELERETGVGGADGVRVECVLDDPGVVFFISLAGIALCVGFLGTGVTGGTEAMRRDPLFSCPPAGVGVHGICVSKPFAAREARKVGQGVSSGVNGSPVFG